MDIKATLIVAVVFCLAAADGIAGDVFYLGRGSSADTAILEESGRGRRHVQTGDVLAELGVLTGIENDEIVFERALAEDERAQLRELGLAAPDVRRIHLQRRRGTQASASPGSGAVLTAD